MEIVIGIFCIIIAIVIQVIFANVFANLAEQKGHSKTGYFWACFLLGSIGYVLVAALPDVTLQSDIASLRSELTKYMRNNHNPSQSVTPDVAHKNQEDKKIYAESPVLKDGVWICNSCGRRNTKESSVCWNCKKAR